MIRRLCSLMLVATLVAASCGGDGDNGAGDTTRTPGASGTEALSVGESYARAFAREGDRSLEDMLALVSPGSVADLHARHTLALSEIQTASGETPETAAVSLEGDTVVVELTPTGGSPTRTEWSDFEIDDDGLLTGFMIDGVALEGRLVGSGEPTEVDGVGAHVVSGFQLVTSGRPIVIVEIANGSDAAYVVVRATYRAPDGAELATGPSGDALGVPPGGSNRVALLFDEADFGGSITLNGDLDGSPVRHELAIEP